MKDTIKSTNGGYRVVKVKNIITNETAYRIDDGKQPLFVAEKRSFEDYEDEHEENEMFVFCEVFTTQKGNQYIYWRDEEIDVDYITEIRR